MNGLVVGPLSPSRKPGRPPLSWSSDPDRAAVTATLALEAAGFSKGAASLLVAMLAGHHEVQVDRHGVAEGVLRLTLRRTDVMTGLESRARHLERKADRAIRLLAVLLPKVHEQQPQSIAANEGVFVPGREEQDQVEHGPALKQHASSGDKNVSNRLLRPNEVAAMLDLSESARARRRMNGDGPPYVKSGYRTVRYRQADVEAWLASCQRGATSAAA